MSSKHRSQKGKVQTVGNKNVTSFKIYIYNVLVYAFFSIRM